MKVLWNSEESHARVQGGYLEWVQGGTLRVPRENRTRKVEGRSVLICYQKGPGIIEIESWLSPG